MRDFFNDANCFHSMFKMDELRHIVPCKNNIYNFYSKYIDYFKISIEFIYFLRGGVMLIIVDAYNYMKVISGMKHISEQEEQRYMRQFQKYMKIRGNQLMIVFDGGPSLHVTDETIGGVHVVYSGEMHSADDVIIEYVHDHVGEDILVVTSDREIRNAAKKCNIVSISSPDFYKIFKDVLDQRERYEHNVVRDVVKTAESEDSDLDQLMELGSRNIGAHVKFEEQGVPRVVRNSKKSSKFDKWTMRKINKI